MCAYYQAPTVSSTEHSGTSVALDVPVILWLHARSTGLETRGSPSLTWSLTRRRQGSLRRPAMPPFVPDRSRFLELAGKGRLAFVYREWLADSDTPVSAYAKLGRGPYSFLLESVVGGEKL